MNRSAVVYIHGKGGNAGEALHFKPLFPDFDVLGLDYRSETPWEARQEFPAYFRSWNDSYDEVVLIANSIGAYFAMQALSDRPFAMTFFISPIVDMEALILRMMSADRISERDLRDRKEIRTSSGEILTWDYLRFARTHPATWSSPAEVLYGETDFLTSFAAVSAFAERIGAGLTVMKGGEHWFHTDEQMAFLDSWIAEKRGGPRLR